MADIRIHGVPDNLYERYKRLAQKHHRTLSAETIFLIKNAVMENEQLEQRWTALARITERRRHLPSTPPETLDSLAMLREDRAR